MKQPIHKRPWIRRTTVLLLLLLLAYGSYRAIRPNPKLRKVRQLQAEFAAAKDWTPEQRREKGQEMRAAMAKLTFAQRETLADERQQRAEEQMRRYAQMTSAEKTRHLDEIINRSEQMRRQSASRNTSSQRPSAAGAIGSGGPGNRGSASQSPEEREKRRKERLNRTSPEYRATLDMFRKDMENRRRQRGLPATGR